MPHTTEEIKKKCGERLKELLKQLRKVGITQTQMAKDISLSQQTISNIATGKASLTRINAEYIAEYYQEKTGESVRVEWLMCYDDAKTYDDEWDTAADAFEKEWIFRESCFLYAIRNLGYTAEELPKPLHPELAGMYGQEGCYEYYHIKKDGEVIATLSNYDVNDIEEDMVALLCAIVKRGIKRANDDVNRDELAKLYRKNTEMLKQGRNYHG